jgi:hypothetical protein
VVGGERAAQVQAEQSLLDQGEGDRLERREHQQQGRHLDGGMHQKQQQPLDQVGPAAAAEEGRAGRGGGPSDERRGWLGWAGAGGLAP